MAYDSEHDWENAAERLEGSRSDRNPRSLATRGMQRGLVAARRQALGCGTQAATWGGETDGDPFFVGWSRTIAATRSSTPSSNATQPRPPRRTPRLGAFLREEYAPIADPHDPVGRDRYALFAAAFSGIELDLDQTYQWGWEELYRIEERMREVAARIVPGVPVVAVAEHLDHDASRTIEGEAEFKQWNQELIDQTIAELNGPTSTSPNRCAAARR